MAGRFLPPFTQTESALFYFRDRRSIAFEAAGLLPPCRETGSKGGAWCWTPAAAKDGPKLRALITSGRRSTGAGILTPFHQSRDKRGQSK